METSRIAELLAPYFDRASPLNTRQLERISTYIDLLIRWNSRVNLTAIRTPEEIVTRHFGESLFAARHLFPPAESSATKAYAHSIGECPGPDAHSAPGRECFAPLLDLGSGAGFPGLPIKIWTPGTAVTLIESNNKKVAFLREAIRALTLTDINVSATRAEDFPAQSAGTVTLRAVERFTQILPTATRLLCPGGRLALLIGVSQLPQAKHLRPDLVWDEPFTIPGSQATVLAIANAAW